MLGIKWTGVVLALPAMLPIVVLLALSVLVFAVQKWNPRRSRLSSRESG